jgi:hypothetical protein
VLLRYPRLRVILHAGMLVPGETPRFTLHGTLGSYVKHGLDPQEDALKRGSSEAGCPAGRAGAPIRGTAS